MNITNVPSAILTAAAIKVLSEAVVSLDDADDRAEATATSDEEYRSAKAYGTASAAISGARISLIHALRLLGVDISWDRKTV